MLYYCLKCRKNTESKNLKIARTNNGKLIILSKHAVCDSKKSRFIQGNEATKSLRNLTLKIPLSKILVLGDNIF